MAPMRVKSFAQRHAEEPRTPSPFTGGAEGHLPEINEDDVFRDVVKKLSEFITEVVTLPSTFEQLRTTIAGDSLRDLVEHLSLECTNPAIVNALLALKWHYNASSEDKGLGEARASACEIVAWRLLTRLSEREAVDYCLYEIPAVTDDSTSEDDTNQQDEERATETTALLSQAWTNTAENARKVLEQTGTSRRSRLFQSISRLTMSMTFDGGSDDEEDDPTSSFIGLNALEIAAIADAKRFLSQNVVQKIITGIWNGDIVFWDSLSVHAEKKPRFYNAHTADPFSRLRVPKYLKSFEVLFFASFLALYYSVLVERNPTRITPIEVLLYIWFGAFIYDELSEWIDAGSIFYAADVWNLFDVIMMSIGIMFAIMRIIGLSRNDRMIVDLAFDILSLEALFMVPRICSILSLSPYWGTLIPCLKEMGKDFIKFMVLVVIIYLGFLTTFSLVGRDRFSLPDMTMILTKIFFGSSYVGFDHMKQIDPIFGPPLMLIFITLSSILLMGSLTGMLSNSFSRVISHAREEYLYVYSVYVLEASTSNRLTHFYPPFNLLALVIFRPLRIFLPSDNKFRAARILLLKATHLPIVGAIMFYELVRGKLKDPDEFAGFFKGPRQETTTLGTPVRPSLKSQQPKRNSDTSYRRSRFTSVSDFSPRFVRPGRTGNVDEDTGEAPTDVEVRIAELSSKIDKLTDLVVRLQAANDTK
ncbi:uncharacterized protein E0L32_006162 [Thyridium curvatum]|uniref:Calcium channel YVC1-like C-terminal transmembrane domain-containing protein n=1 Tax=Thyridium curvatum TaxID=1093900 RepID=A0A507ATX6_9PEZI|nr:uncharacterized protein E0L32_006162 [Thyridium curvatum]TPX13432.1 hypothetical protein E0L32_006162 [Thyridium curvatum]